MVFIVDSYPHILGHLASPDSSSRGPEALSASTSIHMYVHVEEK